MPQIDLSQAPQRRGTGYPAPYDVPCQRRVRALLGEAVGLTQFGVNLLRLPAGQWTSQRHWHTEEDEFVWVIEGEVVLVTEAGACVLRAGDCAGFKAGVADGHHLQNRSDRDALLLEIGGRDPNDAVAYPGIDLMVQAGAQGYSHIDGTPY